MSVLSRVGRFTSKIVGLEMSESKYKQYLEAEKQEIKRVMDNIIKNKSFKRSDFKFIEKNVMDAHTQRLAYLQSKIQTLSNPDEINITQQKINQVNESIAKTQGYIQQMNNILQNYPTGDADIRLSDVDAPKVNNILLDILNLTGTILNAVVIGLASGSGGKRNSKKVKAKAKRTRRSTKNRRGRSRRSGRKY
jgi:hypothetical protein